MTRGSTAVRGRVRVAARLAALLLGAMVAGCGASGVLAGCGTSGSEQAPSGAEASRSPGQATSLDRSFAAGPSTATRPASPTQPDTANRPASPAMVQSAGWTVTVYYTAVERFHSGPATRVVGCPRLDCAHGHDDLGSYPASFVDAVHAEGTGRTAAGTYLNWSDDNGYWLDSAARDASGRPLRPFESAAADRSALRPGTRFAIVACGHDEDGGTIPATVCDRLRAARWIVSDEFTPGLGGPRHVDVYIGEETGPGFTDSPWYSTLVAATLGTY